MAVTTAANQATLIAKSTGGTIGTLSTVSQSTSSQTALAANSNRKGFTIQNNSNVKVLVKFAATASNSSMSFSLRGGAKYKCPQFENGPFLGRVDVVWESAGALSLNVTEYT